MKRTLFFLLVILTLAACGSNPNAQAVAQTEQEDAVEVLYFHGKQRCITCNAIERLTKEVIEQDFVQQLKDGKIIFKVIDISTKEGEKIANTYEVTWSSLYINKWRGGKENRNNMTDFWFSHAKGSPDVFKAGVKKKIEELLK